MTFICATIGPSYQVTITGWHYGHCFSREWFWMQHPKIITGTTSYNFMLFSIQWIRNFLFFCLIVIIFLGNWGEVLERAGQGYIASPRTLGTTTVVCASRSRRTTSAIPERNLLRYLCSFSDPRFIFVLLFSDEFYLLHMCSLLCLLNICIPYRNVNRYFCNYSLWLL